MSKEFYEKLLRSFSKSNTLRKQKISSDAGMTVEEYKNFLKQNIAGTVNAVVVDVPVTVGRPTIHVVDVLDCSSSMSGAKIKAATKGINKGIQDLQKNIVADYIYSFMTFSYTPVFKTLRKNILTVDTVAPKASGMTALNDAVIKAINEFAKEDRVLINVYTDGGENSSSRTKSDVKTAIDSVKNNITVTFIGTEYDVNDVISNYNIDRTNTMSYDGSATGLEKSINATLESRISYSANVAAGNDVRTGFYKEIVNK